MSTPGVAAPVRSPRAVHKRPVRTPAADALIEVDWRPPEKRQRRNPAVCVMCSLVAGNGAGIKVLRYPLLRRVNPPRKRQTSVCIGSIGLCDRCVIEHGDLNERAKVK